MSDPIPRPTRDLLQRCHGGEEQALQALLADNLDWIKARVRRRLGPRLRRKAETTDIVQETAIEFLRYGPRVVISDQARLRALLARIVENVIRHQHDWFSARRREIDRERALPAEGFVDLDLPRARVERPSEVFERRESEEWVRLAVRLLEPEDQELIYLRQWDRMPFAELGERLEISEDAARMRFGRAVQRLTGKVVQLREGQLDEAVEAEAAEEADVDEPPPAE